MTSGISNSNNNSFKLITFTTISYQYRSVLMLLYSQIFWFVVFMGSNKLKQHIGGYDKHSVHVCVLDVTQQYDKHQYDLT